jgi:hypothetical protein
MKIINIGIIGHGRIARTAVIEVITTKTNHLHKEQPKCKRCGSTKDVMLNGYCITCEEELQSQIK